MNPCTYRISIKAIITNENDEVLLCKEDNGNWELPGGGLEHGENHEECLKRELKEEMGLEIVEVEKKPTFFSTFLRNCDNGTWVGLVWYKIKVKNLDITPSDECVEIKFFNKETIKSIEGFKSIKKAVIEYFESI